MCSSDWTYLWTSFADSATSFADSATSFVDSATMELATWVDRERVLLSAYRSYNRDSLTTFWKPRVECDSERHAEARRRVDVLSTSHEDIKLIKYSSQKEDIFRRIKENIGLPGDSGRIGVRTMCDTRWTIKVDALGGSITSNCTVLRSTPDDANDVDRTRYGDEGKNSRHFVSNEQIPLPVRDHIGRTTAGTPQQLELKSAAHVASATKVNN